MSYGNTDTEDMFATGTAAFDTGASQLKQPATGSKPIEKESVPGAPKLGRGPIPFDKRKFGYDVTRGRAKSRGFGVSKEDRLTAVEAGEFLHRIHKVFGIDRAEEGVLSDFDNALFFNHTINGGSILQPGRAKLVVGTTEFDVHEVDKILGVEKRRFYRAFADEIIATNKKVMEEYDPYVVETCERYGWLMQVARARGLQKYPYLAHDSADAAVSLSPTEQEALAISKRGVISTSDNNADHMFANDRVISAGLSRTRSEVAA